MRKSPQNFSEFALESGLAGALNHVCKTVLVYRLAKFTDIFLKKSTYKKKKCLFAAVRVHRITANYRNDQRN